MGYKKMNKNISFAPEEWSSNSTPVPSAGATGQAGQAFHGVNIPPRWNKNKNKFHWAGKAGRFSSCQFNYVRQD